MHLFATKQSIFLKRSVCLALGVIISVLIKPLSDFLWEISVYTHLSHRYVLQSQYLAIGTQMEG